MTVDVYSRNGCGACIRVKNRLKALDIEYKEHIIDVDVTKEFIVENFPGKNVLPIVVINDVVYSGAPVVEAVLNEYGKDIGKDLLNESVGRFVNEGGYDALAEIQRLGQEYDND